MAIRHLYTVVCDYVVVGQDGRATAVGILHNIEFAQFPATKSLLGLVVGLVGDDGDEFRVALEGPDERSIAEVSKGTIAAPRDLRENQQWGFTVAGAVTPVVFAAPGIYAVTVWEGARMVHRYPFGVLSGEPSQEVGDDER